MGHHLLIQHRSFSGRNPSIVNFFAFAHHLGKARTAGKLYSHVNPETSSPATYRQPVRSLSSAAPLSSLTPVDGRPALFDPVKTAAAQVKVPFGSSNSRPPPPPFRPPLATCWCRLSKQPAGAEGASCTRGTPARPAAATAAKQQPPSPQKPVRPPERGEAKATTTLRVTGLERPGHPSFPVLVRCAPSEHRANNEHRTGISPPPSKLLAHPSILSSLDSSAASLVHLLVRQWRRGRRLPLRRRVRCHQ